jgi:ABC-2 type transport system ATP-binding protein
MMPIIQVSRLSKVFRAPSPTPGAGGAVRQLIKPRYVHKAGLRSVDLRVEAGEAVACLGPNGAGKSTLIKILCGVLSPTDGTVLVNGVEPHRSRRTHVRSIGVVFGHRTNLWWDVPLADSLRYLKSLYHVADREYDANIDLFRELLGIGAFMDMPIRRLSLGQRLRADLAAAFVHSPALVFLDEPTIGLDIAAKEAIRRFIRQVNADRSVTILLTSHDTADVENLCERVFVMRQGEKIYDGDIDSFRNTYATESELVVRIRRPAYRDGSLADAAPPIREAPAGLRWEWSGESTLNVFFDRGKLGAHEALRLVEGQVEVLDFMLKEPGIEDTLRRVPELWR